MYREREMYINIYIYMCTHNAIYSGSPGRAASLRRGRPGPGPVFIILIVHVNSIYTIIIIVIIIIKHFTNVIVATNFMVRVV